MPSKDYRKCIFCNSIWVCWNWIHSDDWAHECWDCDSCHTTPKKAVGGISYAKLKSTYPEENKIQGEIKACNEVILNMVAASVKMPADKAFYLKRIEETQKAKNKYLEELTQLIESKKKA